jgi:pimeloyl-ACP methyl ester carboxylesterase
VLSALVVVASLAVPSESIDLPIAGFGNAIVWAPSSKKSRPIVVAVHGNRDRPEWPCWRWARIVEDRAFVLCPRGVARKDDPSRFTYSGSDALSKEIEAGVAALVAKYGARVDASARVYAGHSLGANLGAALLSRDPDRWSAAVFSEGGAAQWAPWVAASFAKQAKKRALFACGQVACLSEANAAAAKAKTVTTRIVLGKGGGHHFYGPVADAIEESFDWLVETDPRFAG